MSDYYLLFKWGTLKGWNVPEGKPLELLQKAMIDAPISTMCDRPNDDRKKAMCELIDEMAKYNASFANDWDGDKYDAEQAKEYILNYG
jgi:hypothetical protein